MGKRLNKSAKSREQRTIVQMKETCSRQVAGNNNAHFKVSATAERHKIFKKNRARHGATNYGGAGRVPTRVGQSSCL